MKKQFGPTARTKSAVKFRNRKVLVELVNQYKDKTFVFWKTIIHTLGQIGI